MHVEVYRQDDVGAGQGRRPPPRRRFHVGRQGMVGGEVHPHIRGQHRRRQRLRQLHQGRHGLRVAAVIACHDEGIFSLDQHFGGPVQGGGVGWG